VSEFVLHRHEDPSNVSGTGTVAYGCEFADGSVALHWPGQHPATTVWGDIRGVEAIHGHGGLTVVDYLEPHRLVKAWEQVGFWLLSAAEDNRPMQIKPHPDWPDRLLVTFRYESTWRFWTALMDGSTDAATHVEVAGETVHTFVTPDGNVWLTYTSPIDEDPYDEHPLETFDREDR
jgi:hypothetical protein